MGPNSDDEGRGVEQDDVDGGVEQDDVDGGVEQDDVDDGVDQDDVGRDDAESNDDTEHDPPRDREQWENWSGCVAFEPAEIQTPTTEAEVQSLVRRCNAAGRTIRVAGEGHSWSPLVETDDVLVSLEELTGVVDVDEDACEATIRGGSRIGEVATELHEHGLAFPNLGDVSLQTVAGAFATGTHGTGPAFENLAGRLIGGRLVTGTGDVRAFGAHEDAPDSEARPTGSEDSPADPEFLRAARVSLGALGIFTELRLDLVRAFKIQRREYCTSYAEAREKIPELIEQNRNFDCYWYPRSDEVKLRLLNAPGGGTDHEALDFAELVTEDTGWWHGTIPTHNDIGREFEEMEYAVPRSVGLECFEAIRDRVRERWRGEVGWRMLLRTVAQDDGYLTADYDRETTTIGAIQNAQLEYWDYFQDLEGIFLEYDGRPHWGKHHTQRAEDLRERYPEWDRFQAIRRECDPDGTFTTDYLRDLLGEVPDAEAELLADGAGVPRGGAGESGDGGASDR